MKALYAAKLAAIDLLLAMAMRSVDHLEAARKKARKSWAACINQKGVNSHV